MGNRTHSLQIRQIIKQAVQNVVLPVCYTAARRRRVDPKLVVFADAHHNSRPAAMELLYRKLKKDGSWKIVEHYLDYGTAGAGAVARHSMSFMKLYAQAGAVVICDNFLPVSSCRKRPQTKVIQLWHACGCYKKFGYDAPDDIPPNYHGANVYRNADLVTVSAQAAIGPFASAMRLPDSSIQALGVSRTDLYYSTTWKERCRAHFHEQYPEAAGKKVVVWAPTFRGNAGAPEKTWLDLDGLQRQLGDDWYVLARLHPHMQSDVHKTCTIPTEELYPVADVLIADYSSLIYEYLLVGKELVLYVPDLDEYRSRRGFYMDIEEIPAQIVTQESELAEAIRHAAGQQAAAGQEDTSSAGEIEYVERTSTSQRQACRRNFLQTYMDMCDGRATGRIARWMAENIK